MVGTLSASSVVRPGAISPHEAGRSCRGGWLSPEGEIFPAAYLGHLKIAADLRASGSGPCDPWDMQDGWVMIRTHGEVIALPNRLTQPQWDALGDMLLAAPDSNYRAVMRASLRTIRGLESSGS